MARGYTRLTPQQETWMVRRHMEGITHEQIGRELDVSGQAITQRLYRWRKRGVNIPRGGGLNARQRQAVLDSMADLQRTLENLER